MSEEYIYEYLFIVRYKDSTSLSNKIVIESPEICA